MYDLPAKGFQPHLEVEPSGQCLEEQTSDHDWSGLGVNLALGYILAVLGFCKGFFSTTNLLALPFFSLIVLQKPHHFFWQAPPTLIILASTPV